MIDVRTGGPHLPHLLRNRHQQPWRFPRHSILRLLLKQRCRWRVRRRLRRNARRRRVAARRAARDRRAARRDARRNSRPAARLQRRHLLSLWQRWRDHLGVLRRIIWPRVRRPGLLVTCITQRCKYDQFERMIVCSHIEYTMIVYTYIHNHNP